MVRKSDEILKAKGDWDIPVFGLVVFARGACFDWVTSIFQFNYDAYEQGFSVEE